MTDPFGPGDQTPPTPPQTPPVTPPGYPVAPGTPESSGAQPPGYPGQMPDNSGGFGQAPDGAPGQPVQYAQTGMGGPNYAGFGSRLIATLIDGLIATVIMTVVSIPLILLLISQFETELGTCTSLDTGREYSCDQPTDEWLRLLAICFVIFLILSLVFTLFYYVVSVGKKGQTPGRKLAGVRVVSEATGQPPGFGKSLGRYLFASIISGSIFYLGFLWNIWDEKKQTWHDKVVGTIVIKE